MLKELTIKNFRGIREGTLSDFGRVNILVGPNGCGKSTVLEAIYLAPVLTQRDTDILGGSRQQFLIEHRNEAQDILPIKPGRVPQFWHFRSEPDNVIQITLRNNNGSGSEVGNMSAGDFSSNHGDVATDLDWLKFMDGLFFATELHLMKDVEKMLGDALIARRADKKIATLFREIYGLEMEGLSFGKPGLLMALFPSEGVRIDDLGAGMRISIRLMILLMSMRKTALLLEEFDAYQFPESLETLARILVRSAKESEMQIIMTTHSMESIRSFLAACNLEGIPDFRLFPLVRTKDGTLRTKALSLDATQELAAAGFDLRTLGSNE